MEEVIPTYQFYYAPSFKDKKLIFRSTSLGENDRSRKEFLRIKKKLLDNQPLNIEEKKFFYMGIRISQIPEDGLITDYEECNDNHFKFTYLAYARDLTGGGTYMNVKNGKFYRREPEEIQSDLLFLEKCYEKWKKDLENIQPSDRVLVFINQEINEHLKVLKGQPDYNEMGFFRKSNKYLFAEKEIYLRAKWLKLSADEFFFYSDPEKLSIEVNGRRIKFDERSYVHITYRHYAVNNQGVDRGKTYHSIEINHYQIHQHVLKILKRIFSNGIEPMINTPINFLYRGKPFEIYLIEEAGVFIVISFYPLPMEDLGYFSVKRPIDNELVILRR